MSKCKYCKRSFTADPPGSTVCSACKRSEFLDSEGRAQFSKFGVWWNRLHSIKGSKVVRTCIGEQHITYSLADAVWDACEKAHGWEEK